MDQIFERLEKLVKAWVNTGSSSPASFGNPGQRRGYGDPDLDAAMAELDDFLDPGKTETERREADERRAQTAREERAREEKMRGDQRRGQHYSHEGTTAVIEDAYRYLGLAPYTPFAEVKTAYKKLLFKYHPDRNASTPDALKKATESSTRINAAYQIIEAYEDSRKAG